MPRYRVSLAGSLGIVAVVAMGMAGMRSASTLWATAAATVTLALLLSAPIAARLLDGLDRAFWAGFALFGWSYLVLVNWDWVGGPFGHDLTAGLSDAAEAFFARVDAPLPPPPPTVSFTARPPQNLGIPPNPNPANPAAAAGFAVISQEHFVEQARARQIKLGNFVQIGRMFLSLMFGLAGGLIARAIALRRAPAATTTVPSALGPAGPAGG